MQWYFKRTGRNNCQTKTLLIVHGIISVHSRGAEQVRQKFVFANPPLFYHPPPNFLLPQTLVTQGQLSWACLLDMPTRTPDAFLPLEWATLISPLFGLSTEMYLVCYIRTIMLKKKTKLLRSKKFEEHSTLFPSWDLQYTVVYWNAQWVLW